LTFFNTLFWLPLPLPPSHSSPPTSATRGRHRPPPAPIAAPSAAPPMLPAPIASIPAILRPQPQNSTFCGSRNCSHNVSSSPRLESPHSNLAPARRRFAQLGSLPRGVLSSRALLAGMAAPHSSSARSTNSNSDSEQEGRCSVHVARALVGGCRLCAHLNSASQRTFTMCEVISPARRRLPACFFFKFLRCFTDKSAQK
jgi:hypothetical protein